jgi:hypothetical protein
MEPREFLIDMTVPAEERWQDVIVSSRRNALKLARWVLTTLDRMPLSQLVRGAISASHRRSSSLFDDDLSAWAAGLGMPHRDLLAVNAAHEIAQFTEVKLSCTSVVLKTGKLGMIHGRNLDWEMQGLGESTVVYHFVGCPLEFMAVSLPGLVGVLSGMGPGRFSVTVSRATPSGRPTMDWDPHFLTRHVLQTAIDYDHAVTALSEAALRTPAIFTVASASDERACVIERTRKGHAIREFTGAPLVAANHFLSPELVQFNTTPALIDLSQAQLRAARKVAEKVQINELGDLFEVLNADGMVTDFTCQQVALSPTEGFYCAVGRAT